MRVVCGRVLNGLQRPSGSPNPRTRALLPFLNVPAMPLVLSLSTALNYGRRDLQAILAARIAAMTTFSFSLLVGL